MGNEEYKDLIIFLDENDQKVNQYVNIIELKDSYVTFKNISTNLITIPINRVLKIKRREE